jgi:hypothetical protein
LDASSVTILKDIFKDPNELKVLKTELAYIHANFSFLSQSVTKLEKATNLLSETKESTTFKINRAKPTAQKLM